MRTPYGLKWWYEEPGDPLEFDLLGEVSEAGATPSPPGEPFYFFLQRKPELFLAKPVDAERT